MRDLGLTKYTNEIAIGDSLVAIRERNKYVWEKTKMDIVECQVDDRELPKLEDVLKFYRDFAYLKEVHKR
jgi:hypothetical protein